MNKTVKIALWGTAAVAAGAGLVWGISKLTTAKRDIENMEFRMTGWVDKKNMTFSKIPVKVRVFVKNASHTSLKFRWPHIKIFYKGTLIGSSDVSDYIVTIPEYAVKEITKKKNEVGGETITPITVDLYILKMGALAADIFRIIQTTQGTVTIQAKMITYLFIGDEEKQYETTTDITL